MNIKTVLGLPLAALLATAIAAPASAAVLTRSDGIYVRCDQCGVVQSIENVGRTPNATGAVLGGIVGAVAGREIAKNQTDSKGRQNTATVAGAVAGAAVGNAIQNHAGTGYNIVVRTNDGRTLTAMQDDIGAIRVGSYVEVKNGHAYLR